MNVADRDRISCLPNYVSSYDWKLFHCNDETPSYLTTLHINNLFAMETN